MSLDSQMLIDGDWTAASSGATSNAFNPATGGVITTFPEASIADVNMAVSAARRAYESDEWQLMSPDARGRILWKISELIERDATMLSEIETENQGQTLIISRFVTVQLAAEVFRYYAGWCTKIEGRVSSVSIPNTLHYTRREPIGVVGLITPWNFPLAIAAWKLAPALACGNAVILKPAEQTPLSTLHLARLCVEAGLPSGILNCITGGPEVGKAMVSHPEIDKISFTGSTEVGQEIVKAASRDLKRVSLELGGKAPSIITKDADIDAAVIGNLQGALFNTGQACGAYTRFFVDKARGDEFTEKIARAAAGLKVGAGKEPDTELGPLISQEQIDRVAHYVSSGIEQGATLVSGGKRSIVSGYEGGFFFEPTIFSNVRDDMTIAKDEIFGPVLSIMTYGDEEEIVARANDTNFGLAAVVWTQDLVSAHSLAHRIHAGTVFINQLPLIDPGGSWGGFGMSGWGREMGSFAIDEFTESKGVFVNLAR
ncbi:MAG: betaine-aldehyde dehydrogenase [Actinobacteria bacterium]|nr:MAG: betaine-aldehyde dehydrogenase [Actinomycetota bacterium]